jgi:hypothetical protein
MKRFFIFLAAALIAVSGMGQTAKKSQNAKSSKDSAPKTVYIEAKKRNYAQNLGGYYFYDYIFKESRDLYTQCPCKGEGKKLIAQYTYATFDEAYANLLTFPEPKDLDTREKLTYYFDCVLAPKLEAVKLYEPEPEYDAEVKRLQKLRMDNAKLAAKGKPFDTIPFDPKWPQYNKVLDKIKDIATPIDKQYRDILNVYSVQDPDLKEWLNITGGSPRFYYNAYSALLKQIVKEWFVSDECKQVQAIEDELRARIAAEQPKKTPDWFVEGRQREGELVAQYNRKIVDRWLKKAPTSTMASTKTAITKLIACYKDIEAIHGDDPITEAYISAHTSCKECIKTIFQAYYSVMMTLPVPLVRTPDTQEGKKLKLEETPWVLPHPYEPRD